MKKTRRMTVRLEQAQWRKLEQLATVVGATPSDAVRLLVERADVDANNRNTQTLPSERVAVASA